MKIILIVFVTAAFWSCSNFGKKKNNISENLIAFETEFVMEDGEHANGYYMDRNNFIKPYLKKEYLGDTLIAETLHEINSCSKTVGDLKFSNDTLYLLTKVVDDEACASIKFYKCKYTIVKKEIKKYVVAY